MERAVFFRPSFAEYDDVALICFIPPADIGGVRQIIGTNLPPGGSRSGTDPDVDKALSNLIAKDNSVDCKGPTAKSSSYDSSVDSYAANETVSPDNWMVVLLASGKKHTVFYKVYNPIAGATGGDVSGPDLKNYCADKSSSSDATAGCLLVSPP